MGKQILDGLLAPVAALLTLGIVLWDSPFLYRQPNRQPDAIQEGFTPEYAVYLALQDAKYAGGISPAYFSKIVERCWAVG